MVASCALVHRQANPTIWTLSAMCTRANCHPCQNVPIPKMCTNSASEQSKASDTLSWHACHDRTPHAVSAGSSCCARLARKLLPRIPLELCRNTTEWVEGCCRCIGKGGADLCAARYRRGPNCSETTIWDDMGSAQRECSAPNCGVACHASRSLQRTGSADVIAIDYGTHRAHDVRSSCAADNSAETQANASISY